MLLLRCIQAACSHHITPSFFLCGDFRRTKRSVHFLHVLASMISNPFETQRLLGYFIASALLPQRSRCGIYLETAPVWSGHENAERTPPRYVRVAKTVQARRRYVGSRGWPGRVESAMKRAQARSSMRSGHRHDRVTGKVGSKARRRYGHAKRVQAWSGHRQGQAARSGYSRPREAGTVGHAKRAQSAT
jgi:hypothetical protein